MPDAEQQELLLAFVEEGRELLDESEPLLIELESRSNESGEVDYEVLNTIFRLFHSLKGGAGFLDLPTIGKVTHKAETLLDLFRKGNGSIKSGHIDLLTRTCDFLRKLLDNVDVSFNDNGFDDDANELIVALSKEIAIITGTEVEATPEPVEIAIEEPVSESSDEHGADEAPADSEETAADDGEDPFKLTITPEMVKQYIAESEDLLSAVEDSFLILDKEPDNSEEINDAFRSLHSFKGNSGFLGFKDLENLSHKAETVLDKVRLGEMKANTELFSLLLEIVDFLRIGITSLSEGKDPDIPSASGLISLMEAAIKKMTIETPKPKADGADKASPQPTPTVVNTDKGKEAPEPVESAAVVKTSKSAPKPLPAKTTAQKAKPAPKAVQRQSIRVDVEKLEVLLDLVGELVIAEAMVSQNPDIKDLDVSLENFEKSSMHLNKITRDLQDVATSIRMVPLSGTFRRMIRLVRDLAQKTGKKVDLQIIGEGTEVDKTVIEQIADPLVHIIRNSIDHGISKPADRKKSGKSETGTVTLEAKYVGGEVWISIKDDGNGLNREKILSKAIEKGLVEGDGSDVPDHEVWQLIFAPGFSTADKVTDVSGRGVGMDVVKRNIENIRGKVEVNCVPGKGSEVVLRIPLTLAIIDGMIIKVGSTLYIIPIIAIIETIRVSYDDITKTMDGQEILNVRGHLHPVIRMHEFYNIEPAHTELPDGIVMIVEDSGKRFCLFVDELVGQQQVVIKGLSEYLGHIHAISGCTILADGTVCLIVDVAGVSKEIEISPQKLTSMGVVEV